METDLINKKCVPCEGGTPPLSADEVKNYLSQLKEEWKVLGVYQRDPASLGDRIHKQFKFGDFKQAVEFVNKVAGIAENEGHHPDIAIRYSKVEITLWTHAIGGLSENDFILAAKIDNI